MGPHYRYPRWDDFTEEFQEQFRDVTTELTHEKRMGEMKMGNDPAHVYFRKLEREAKLANRLTDQSECGMLVLAVRKGILHSYGQVIANIGFGIPCTYPQWKQRILQMYDEREKQKVFDQTQGHEDHHMPSSQKQTTATSTHKSAGGLTSFSATKMTGDGKAQESGGRWVTPTGADARMQVDRKKYMSEGWCFTCHELGHISKDCSKKKLKVRAVETVAEETTLTTKAEEVKE